MIFIWMKNAEFIGRLEREEKVKRGEGENCSVMVHPDMTSDLQ